MPSPKDPQKVAEWRGKLVLSWQNSTRRKRMSELLKKRRFSEETRRKMSQTRKIKGLSKGEKNPFYGKHHTGETKKKIGDSNRGGKSARYGKPPWNKGLKYDEETREKMSERAKKVHREYPEIGEKISQAHKGKKFSKKHRMKISEKIKEFYKKNPKFNRLENNPSWYGGVSFEPYSPEFNKRLKKEILTRDNYTCQLCGDYISQNTKNKFILVHHINYDKKDSQKKNLISLCNFCNSSVNSSREQWIKHFREMM